MGHMGKLSDRFSAAFQELNTLHFFFFCCVSDPSFDHHSPTQRDPFCGPNGLRHYQRVGPDVRHTIPL
jgi:hypothetical protein